MKEFYDNTKQFILNNYKGEIDAEVLDILTASVMSLFIRFEDVSKMRMPDVLKRLEIYFGNTSIADMVSQRYPEYPISEISETTDAFVTRALSFGDDKKYDEEWSMYVSTNNSGDKIAVIIGKTTHELIHLLRFNGIVDVGDELKIRDGVSIARCNKDTMVTKRKHYNLEEGIVEFFTVKAMDSLYDFIGNQDVSFSPALEAIKKRYKTDYKASYEIEQFFLNGLTRDKKFSDLLEDSFVDQNEPLSLITYYNGVVGDATAFTRLSRSLDKAIDYANNEDVDNFDEISKDMISQINSFLSKRKSN